MANFSYAIMKCQLIKSTYGFWLQKIYKRLADINPDFMKSYFTIKNAL